ncbi:hypothetical protein [Paenibacillus silviterrae]|uniref:hypothetical protein n=1 Tax=Paenibacillus silviterrae TaxID=3242194 RepID=UPI0025438C3F|nr:hypothetical protein [Paenibacillus chinjuensis]
MAKDNPETGKAAVGDVDSFGLQPTSFVLNTEGNLVEAAKGFEPNMINETDVNSRTQT